MSQYYNMLKGEMLDFSKTLIDKYTYIGLEETDTILLIKLKKVMDAKNNLNDTVKLISQSMSISESEVNKRIALLIAQEYISIDLNKGIEEYSIDPTIKRLANVLENEDAKEEKKEVENDLKKTVAFIEKETGKIISPSELEIIKHWIDVDKFTFNEIKDATLECLKNKQTAAIKYIDMFLNKNRKQNDKSIYGNTDFQELFDQVYGRTKK